MIAQGKLQRIANAHGVRMSQIQKDYMISWILWGISRNKVLSEALIFKGGTCLKKIYFGDYRYSEDMDFTIHPNVLDTLTDDNVYEEFEKVFSDIERTARLKFNIPEDSKNPHVATNSMKFGIAYSLPSGAVDAVKIDATRGEVLEFNLEYKSILHEYEDLADEREVYIQSYSLKEVIIEKMVALMSRVEPRDMYDFDYITDEVGLMMQEIFAEFNRKAVNKGRNPEEFIERLSANKEKLKRTWERRLSHQIQELPDFEEMWRRIERQFRAFESVS
jgi:uncharacterized protein